MSKVKNNPLLKGVSGKLGDVVVYRQLRDGQTVMANTPKAVTSISESQLIRREKFKKAAAYAKNQMKDPVSKAAYEANIGSTLMNAFSLAVRDYLKAPSIDQVDVSQYGGAAGDTIAIRASDDFEVESVTVQIAETDGSVVETGTALENENGEWIYTATSANAPIAGSKVTVQAKDRPGNITTEEITL